jgi:hypothetical protein
MFSFSKRGVAYVGLAIAVCFSVAASPAIAQHTGHAAQDSTKKMPMKMPMGTVTKKKQSKKPAVKNSTKKKTTASKTARKAQSTPTKHTGMPMKTQPAAKADSAKMNMMDMPAKAADTSHHDMPGMKPEAGHADSMKAMPPGMPMPGMPPAGQMPGMPAGMRMPGMRHRSPEDMMIGPLGISMERMGSGTTWIPDAVTLPSRRRMVGDWMLMAHGFVFGQYDHQSGERGDEQWGSLNWAMLMATRDFGGGRFQARTMLSLDPLTVTKRGYPLLMQSGEAYRGEPLHDRQHPHDFWMELGALYQREITKKVGWSVYAAPSGEPALGPVAFMHRPSAMDNPAAPLGHHWQDATHVSFGVITVGLFSKRWQVEGSFFNGREPDDNRWNFDPIKMDSYSGRLTINPTSHWSFAAGYGFLKSPEALNPDESMHRVTASLLYGARLGMNGQWSSALIWGANKHSAESSFSNSFLFESEAILDRSNTLFGRTELVTKSAEDLVVDNPVVTRSGVTLPGFPTTQRFNLGTAQLGYIRELARLRLVALGLGGAMTLNFVPNLLEPYYGSRTPVGTFVFLRLRPFHTGKAAMSEMKNTSEMHNQP